MKKTFLIIIIVLAITSCRPSIKSAQEITISSTLTFTPSPTITETVIPPVPTITETVIPPVPMIIIDGLKVPDPTFSNPEFFQTNKPDSLVVKFAEAFGCNSEDVGELNPELRTSVNGNKIIVLTTNDLAPSENYDEDGIPLLIAEQGETGEWVWREATPARLFTLNGQLLEVSARTHRRDTKDNDDPSDDTWTFLYDYPGYKQLIIDSGNRLLVGGEISINWIFSNLKKSDWNRVLSDWDNIKNQLDKRQIPEGFAYNWQTSEQVIMFARENNLDVRVNPLPFDNEIPPAFFDPAYSKQDLMKLLEFVTKTRVIKFSKDVGTWTLPAEMVARQRYLNGFGTGQIFKPLETVEMIAQFIKEVDPQARLAYDESGVFENFPSPDFYIHYFNFIDKLLLAGVPIDILIEQGNYWVRSPLVESKFEVVTQEARKRGLAFEGGEVNINLSSIYSSWPNRPAEREVNSENLLFIQAQMYADLVRFHVKYGINGFGLGSLEDENNWQVGHGDHNANTTLSPNYSGERKPAWYAFMAAALESFE